VDALEVPVPYVNACLVGEGVSVSYVDALYDEGVPVRRVRNVE